MDVTVLTALNEPKSQSPRYLSFSEGRKLDHCDVLIAVRTWQSLLSPIRARLKLFWTGDSYDALPTLGIGDPRVSALIDCLLCVSTWQAQTLSNAAGWPSYKTWVLGNGVYLPYFHKKQVERRRTRLIYSSTPQRGLAHVPRLYGLVKALVPDAELQIYSGYGVYSNGGTFDSARESEWHDLRKQLEQLPDCEVHDNVQQEALSCAFMQSSVLFYPCSFEETSCITAMEAQAAGCAIVTTRLAALTETVKNSGLLIEGMPGDPHYDNAFVQATCRLLRDDPSFLECSANGIERARLEFDWEAIARRFVSYLEQTIRLP